MTAELAVEAVKNACLNVKDPSRLFSDATEKEKDGWEDMVHPVDGDFKHELEELALERYHVKLTRMFFQKHKQERGGR